MFRMKKSLWESLTLMLACSRSHRTAFRKSPRSPRLVYFALDPRRPRGMLPDTNGPPVSAEICVGSPSFKRGRGLLSFWISQAVGFRPPITLTAVRAFVSVKCPYPMPGARLVFRMPVVLTAPVATDDLVFEILFGGHP